MCETACMDPVILINIKEEIAPTRYILHDQCVRESYDFILQFYATDWLLHYSWSEHACYADVHYLCWNAVKCQLLPAC